MPSDIEIIFSGAGANHDDQALVAFGYRPTLQRALGRFSSFAVSFSFLSITTGIFANYGYVLTKAGPFGFWTWLLVAAGQMLVALIYAEMAGCMPLAGCAYHWNTKLAGRAVGWFTGWLTLSTYCIGVSVVTMTAVPVLGSIASVTFTPFAARYIAVGLILLQAIINIYGIRLTSKVNTIAVCAELVSIVVMGGAILAAIVSRGQIHASLLTTIPSQPNPYWPGFLMACLLGAWTFVGFETAVDMGEETLTAKRTVPKSVISSMLASIILGFVFIVILTLAIPDVGAITAVDNPLIAIVAYNLGDGATKIFMGFVVVAIFSCSLINIAAASRIVFAIARDGRFLAPDFFQAISAQHAPIAAIGFVTFFGVIFAVFADSLTALYAASAAIPALVYLVTVLSYAAGYKKLPAMNGFSLGKWRWVAIAVAVLWLIVEIGILTLPEEFHSGTYAVGGVLVAGLVLYYLVGRQSKVVWWY